MKKLNALLFNQGGKCFYCNAVLDINEATIDHVIPRAKGGTDDMYNLVVCCKYANHAFADYSPKHKMAVIKQLCCFPSACKKIFPREETIKPPENTENAQVAELEKQIQSTNTQVTELDKKMQSSNTKTQPDISVAYRLLCQAIKSLEDNGEEATNSTVKKKMLVLNPSFSESDYGFKQFNKFLLHALQEDIVTLQHHKSNGNYIVSCVKGAG